MGPHGCYRAEQHLRRQQHHHLSQKIVPKIELNIQ
jgi:hypothetical protein